MTQNYTSFVPKETKTMSHKNLYMNIHKNSFICKNLKLETTQVSFNRWMVKLCYIHISNYSLAIKKVLIEETTWLNLKRIMPSGKKANLSVNILYHSTYITFLKWQNLEMEISGYQGFLVWLENRSRCAYKRSRGGKSVMMELFYILTIWMSISWLWHCSKICNILPLKKTG